MAELDVQPKKSGGSILPWILLGLGVLALLYFLFRGRDGDADVDGVTADSVSSSISNTIDNTASTVRNWWDDVDLNAPSVAYDEVTGRNVNVRGNNSYGVYGIEETVLFDKGKSTIRPAAEADLKQVAASIGKRYKNADVRVYGYTDATGDAASNKQLAEERAAAVRSWMVKNGNVTDAKISLHPVGEGQPVASNSTEAGKQQNRRVEIVAHTEGTNM